MITGITARPARALFTMAAVIGLLAGCTGSASPTPNPSGLSVTTRPTAGPAAGSPTQAATPATTPLSTPAGTPTSTATITGSADYQPGSITYRVVNLFSTLEGGKPDLEVYVRTDGVVTAYRQDAALVFGNLTDYFAPPEPGTVVAMPSGTGSPTCVVNCDHFVVEASTTSGQGKQRTIVVYGDPSSTATTPAGQAATYEMWEYPDADAIGRYANAMPPADPAKVTILAFADPVEGADFGLRVARPGQAGCSKGVKQPTELVGGTQIVAFAYDPGAFDLMIHDSSDADCSKDPVGGPFSVLADAGSRGYLVLYGKPGSMQALTIPIP